MSCVSVYPVKSFPLFFVWCAIEKEWVAHVCMHGDTAVAPFCDDGRPLNPTLDVGMTLACPLLLDFRSYRLSCGFVHSPKSCIAIWDLCSMDLPERAI